MDISSILLAPAVKDALSLFRERLSKKLDRRAPTWQPVFDRLEDYVGDVLRWSSRIQFFGMPEAKDIDDATVDLRLSEPRRFRSPASVTGSIGEADLLSGAQNYVILGDPGSGKSTTLKRLARAVMLGGPTGQEDLYRYPLVIRLREHVSSTEPDIVLANTVGIPYELRAAGESDQHYATGDQRLADVIPKFLDIANAVLMLDGLDELPQQTRKLFEEWVVALTYRLSASKILITSRSGDYYRHLDGFNLVELCPLRPEQARAIAQKWLPDADEFLKLLGNVPYYDVTDRPLLLSQLIVLFRRQGTLPEQPSHIYRRLLRLLLEDWDKERGISRVSRYAGFDPDRKADFLAALSYHMTYKLRRTSFTLTDLAAVYGRIHQLFGLPRKEALEVAEEIASHSGLIVASGDGFEFSHLSFQEYLCAYHLVREPFPDHLERYAADYPAPLAVAVAISASPANWFAGLILNRPPFNLQSLRSFLARLRLERPMFDTSAALGMAVMLLVHESAEDPDLRYNIQFLLEDSAVLDSIRQALLFYALPGQEQKRPGEIVLRATSHLQSRFRYKTPERVSVPEQTLSQILKERPVSIPVEGRDVDIVRLDESGKIFY